MAKLKILQEKGDPYPVANPPSHSVAGRAVERRSCDESPRQGEILRIRDYGGVLFSSSDWTGDISCC